MNACEITVGITAIANAIANEVDDDTLAFLSAVLVSLGDMLAAIAAAKALHNC